MQRFSLIRKKAKKSNKPIKFDQVLGIPYFVILMYGVYSVFKDYKNKFTFLNISLLFSIALTFVAGIFSGNVFDEWICTLFLGFMCGCLLLNLNKKES